ncbi:hypothetical protein [Aeromicrobium sp. 9AM]|uniref:hypothetical protein n=1 Tax=Aeromicrobium sp. 9AM TaxID=2653126 RepID=UPI0012F03022|nr:hypothetical protein [Aeromicrobium sp. 9AM]VXB17982.1 conserved exported hypothetical protein [Aeromicrobium sp. 9AM]
MLRRIITAGATCVATIALGGAAVAADSPDTGVVVSESGAVTMSGSTAATYTRNVTDSDCAETADTAGSCTVASTVSVGAIGKATSTQLATDAKATSTDGTTLAAAAAARTIYTRTFEQSQRGLYYINWVEKHIGRVYFDKAGHVWSTTTTYGYKGYHTCDLGSGIGYSIKVTSCSVEKRYDLNGPAISLWDRYQVHVVASGIPIYQSHNMHANAYDGGTITFP